MAFDKIQDGGLAAVCTLSVLSTLVDVYVVTLNTVNTVEAEVRGYVLVTIGRRVADRTTFIYIYKKKQNFVATLPVNVYQRRENLNSVWSGFLS